MKTSNGPLLKRMKTSNGPLLTLIKTSNGPPLKRMKTSNGPLLTLIKTSNGPLLTLIKTILGGCVELIRRINGGCNVVRQQELLYAAEFNIQQLERKVARAGGERSDEERRLLNTKIEQRDITPSSTKL
eukprot:1105661-Prorocentrum_minimum.AAC.2